MQLPYSDVLDIAHFSRLFDNKSECCKLFWFQAIARKMKEGHKTISFEILIDEMIADAWYMVSEYHLNLGPNDALERVVHRLSAISHMKSSEKKEVYYFLQLCGCAELAEARTGEITADHPREGSFCQGVGEISKIHRESGIYPPRPVYCRRHCIHSLSVWG